MLDERDMLDAWLEFHRVTLLLKCEGLDDEPARADRWPPPSCRCMVWCGTWPRSSGTGSAGCCCARPMPRRSGSTRRSRTASSSRSTTPTGKPTLRPGTPSAMPAGGGGGARARRHRRPAGRAVLAAMDLRAHDRGVRTPQRARRHHPRAHRTEASAGKTTCQWTSGSRRTSRTGTTGLRFTSVRPSTTSRDGCATAEGPRSARGRDVGRRRRAAPLASAVSLRSRHAGVGTRRARPVTGLDFSPAAIDAAARDRAPGRSVAPVRFRVLRRLRRDDGTRPRDVRCRVRQSRCAVLAPEHRSLGRAGRGTRRTRWKVLHSRHRTRSPGHLPTTGSSSGTATSSKPSHSSTTPTRRTPMPTDLLCTDAATNGITGSARSSRP